MKKILLIIPFISLLFLLSCQKEAGFTNNNSGGSTSGNGLLTKIVSKNGSDSSILAFGYNSSNKLMTLNTTIVSGGTTTQIQERVERNAQGLITKLIIKSPTYQQAGIDSVVTVMISNSGKYTAKVTTVSFLGFTVKDSVSIIYDANGKVIRERSFDDPGTGSYEETAKIDYTYSGNNIASIKMYSYDASTSSYTLEETDTYDQYDNKISPTNFGYDAFAFDSPFFFS
ncbi:MAG: hypothetical protein ABUT20_66040, partial [Bacteroidota bacterium]